MYGIHYRATTNTANKMPSLTTGDQAAQGEVVKLREKS
jgi:hypothetical protein